MSSYLSNERFLKLAFQFANKYANFTESVFSLVTPYVKVQKVAKGASLCRPGELFSELGMVASGLFKTYYSNPEGQLFIRSFSWEGEHIGPYGSVLAKKPSCVQIEAIEDSIVLKMEHADLVKLYDAHPLWERFGRGIAEEHLIYWEDKEFEHLALDAAGRWAAAQSTLAPILDRISQRDLASYIGVSPETLTRLKKQRN